MKTLRLVVIGGGSSYTPELFSGAIDRWREGQFHAVEFALVDVAEGARRMEVVADFLVRMAKASGMPCHITTHLDRQEALRGATFAISQIRVGQMASRRRDEQIPLGRGAIGQETTGAGGFAKALRTIPVSLEIARDVEEVCKDAWLLNFSNPSGIVTEAIATHTNAKAFGLCNIPVNTRIRIARALSVSPQRIGTWVSGLNHLSFVTAITLDGEDITESFFRSPHADEILGEARYNPDMIRNLKQLMLIPANYLYYYWHPKEALESQMESLRSGAGTRADEVMRVEETLFRTYAAPECVSLPDELKKRGGAFYSKVALDCVSAIANNQPSIEALNVVNRGSVPGIDPDSVVEVSSVVDARGPHPIAQKPLPLEVRGLVGCVKAYEKLTVQAAVYGDKDAAFFALLQHPLVPGASAAAAILEDILTANAEYLPQFTVR